MIKRFKAVLLNAKGLQKMLIEGIVDESDEFSQISTALIDTREIESAFTRSIKRMGKAVCQLRLKSGDTYDVIETLDEVESIIAKANTKHFFTSDHN
jgi:ERCC4-type nuclease